MTIIDEYPKTVTAMTTREVPFTADDLEVGRRYTMAMPRCWEFTGVYAGVVDTHMGPEHEFLVDGLDLGGPRIYEAVTVEGAKAFWIAKDWFDAHPNNLRVQVHDLERPEMHVGDTVAQVTRRGKNVVGKVTQTQPFLQIQTDGGLVGCGHGSHSDNLGKGGLRGFVVLERATQNPTPRVGQRYHIGHPSTAKRFTAVCLGASTSGGGWNFRIDHGHDWPMGSWFGTSEVRSYGGRKTAVRHLTLDQWNALVVFESDLRRPWLREGDEVLLRARSLHQGPWASATYLGGNIFEYSPKRPWTLNPILDKTYDRCFVVVKRGPQVDQRLLDAQRYVVGTLSDLDGYLTSDRLAPLEDAAAELGAFIQEQKCG